MANNYRTEEKRERFSANGERLKTELDVQLAEGWRLLKPRKASLSVEEFESFEFDQAPAGLNPTALQQAQNLDSGALSPMVTSPDQTGIFVYVSEKVVPRSTHRTRTWCKPRPVSSSGPNT